MAWDSRSRHCAGSMVWADDRNLGPGTFSRGGEVRSRYGRGRGLVPGESQGGQLVVDHSQVPEIDVRVGPGECEPAARGVEGEILDHAGPGRECQPRLEGQRVAEDDAPIAPARGQQPPVGAERERLDRPIVPLGEAMDDREIGQRQGDHGSLGIADEDAVGAAVDHESIAACRQRDAPGRTGLLQIEQGNRPFLETDEEMAAPVVEGNRRDGRVSHLFTTEDPTAVDVEEQDGAAIRVTRGKPAARGVKGQGVDTGRMDRGDSSAAVPVCASQRRTEKSRWFPDPFRCPLASIEPSAL